MKLSAEELMMSLGVEQIQEVLTDTGLLYYTNQRLSGDNISYLFDFYVPDFDLLLDVRSVVDASVDLPRNCALGRTYYQKRALCARSYGVGLVQLREVDFITGNLWNVVKERLVCGTVREKVGARECEFGPIPERMVKDFLAQYHTQGYVRADKGSYGLVHDGNPIVVMTFGKPRFNGFDLELIRYCVRPDVAVMGGFEKLLHDALDAMRFSGTLVSFMDLNCRFTDMSVYEKHGFSDDGITAPDYAWVSMDDTELVSRYASMKHVLVSLGFSEEASETDIMLERGYRRMYGAGSVRYTLTV